MNTLPDIKGRHSSTSTIRSRGVNAGGVPSASVVGAFPDASSRKRSRVLTDADLVAVTEHSLTEQTLAVHERAIARSEVARAPHGARPLQQHVHARHRSIGRDRQVGVTALADAERRPAQHGQVVPARAPHLQYRHRSSLSTSSPTVGDGREPSPLDESVVANCSRIRVVVVVDESSERGGESTMTTRSTVTTSIRRIRRVSTIMVGASFVLAGVVSAAPAGQDPTPPATRFPEDLPAFIRGWRFVEYVTDEQAETEVDAGSVGGSAPLDEQYVFGPQTVTNEGPAIGKVQSGPNMTSFRVLTSVPDDGLGNRAEFVSYEAFTKTETLAAYRYRPDHALLAVVDRNGSELLEQECDEPTMTDCSDPIQAEVTFDVAVYTADQVLFRSAGGAMVTGWHGNWTAAAWSEAYATTRLWGRSNFQHPHVDDSAALVMSRPAEVFGGFERAPGRHGTHGSGRRLCQRLRPPDQPGVSDVDGARRARRAATQR